MTSQNYQQVVFNTAKNCGLNDVQAKIIVSQAIHESGNFNSHVFKTDNNLFGMKVPSKRSKEYIDGASTIIKSSEGSTPYAHYDSMQDSVKDLILSWHVYNHTNWNDINSPEDYAAYLKTRGYYGDSETNYTNALVKYFNSLQWLKYTTPIIFFVFAGIALFYILKK